MVKVAVLGASGYTGGELLRILALHPNVEVTLATSREFVGRPIHYVHFNLRGYYKDLRFSRLALDALLKEAEVVFSALPHGVGMHIVASALEAGLKVIDLSADFRLKDPAVYKRWYGMEHPYPDLLQKAVYGLPELHREELRGAQLIASPGCNATASILALAPLVKQKLIDLEKIVVDVKAGSSEGGSEPSRGSHHPEREGAIRPYEAEGHRHSAEASQELSALAGEEVKVSLVPHAVSSVRGALASAHAWLVGGAGREDVTKAFVDMYSREPFVRFIFMAPPGYPDPKYVVGSNYVDVGAAVESSLSRVTAFAALDNLMKGAAGQAVQAFNISMGFDERTALRLIPLKPG
ncbi:MAG: N-acetyl-gamma-glutamyl-phosphate reductase [Acidilobaceae archaeon]|nr:N-acetyl-gamma-glutamyl-phosphate reductase [Acidilobaceae archaeon]MCX8165941.1 N-acetyl-gamma-glutamyl-phosphate reductase [Acidilobaceae archaeon]MDW7974584.1 N-acetyl-gamma-glutamyl-phosphate reductase [Sulfolobales archaeon]